MLKQEGDSDNGVLLLVPCDPRLPRMLVRSAQLPAPIKQVRGKKEREGKKGRAGTAEWSQGGTVSQSESLKKL